eukprot:PhF_6_TR34937/c0_g1_i2/m.50649
MSTPFENVKWLKDSQSPHVYYNKKWWILSSVEGIDATALVKQSKEAFGTLYQQVFSESFVPNVLPLPSTQREVDIDLEDEGTSEIETFKVPLRAKLEGSPEYSAVVEPAGGDSDPMGYSTQANYDQSRGGGYGASASGMKPPGLGDDDDEQPEANMMQKQALAQAFGGVVAYAMQGCGMTLPDIVELYKKAGGSLIEDDEDDDDREHKHDDGSHEM